MTQLWKGHTNLPSVERGTPRAQVVPMLEEGMEEVGTPPEVLEEVAITEGVLQPMTDIDTIPLTVNHTQPFLPNLHSHHSLTDWTTGTHTVCTMKTLEMAVMLQYLFLATQAHRSSLRCKAPSMNSFPPLEGPNHSLHLYNHLHATLSSLTTQRAPT